METIMKEYIEFAIENGFNKKIYHIFFQQGKCDNLRITFINEFETIYSILDIITSKSFIDAIARGIRKNSKSKKVESYKGIIIQYYIDTYIIDETDLIEWIIGQQALAIYNNELPLFAKKILGKN